MYNLSKCKCLVPKWKFHVDKNKSKVERKCEKCNTSIIIERKEILEN